MSKKEGSSEKQLKWGRGMEACQGIMCLRIIFREGGLGGEALEDGARPKHDQVSSSAPLLTESQNP